MPRKCFREARQKGCLLHTYSAHAKSGLHLSWCYLHTLLFTVGSRGEDDAVPEPLSLLILTCSHHPGFQKATSQQQTGWALWQRERETILPFAYQSLSFLQLSERYDSSAHGKDRKDSTPSSPCQKNRATAFALKKCKGSVHVFNIFYL